MAYDRKSMAGRADWPEWVSPVRAAIVVVTVVVLVVVLAWIGVRQGASIHSEPTAPAKSVQLQRHDSLTHTYTHDGSDTIRIYVVTDPDMGVQYVVNDHGGITPRLDRYGMVMGTTTE